MHRLTTNPLAVWKALIGEQSLVVPLIRRRPAFARSGAASAAPRYGFRCGCWLLKLRCDVSAAGAGVLTAADDWILESACARHRVLKA